MKKWFKDIDTRQVQLLPNELKDRLNIPSVLDNVKNKSGFIVLWHDENKFGLSYQVTIHYLENQQNNHYHIFLFNQKNNLTLKLTVESRVKIPPVWNREWDYIDYRDYVFIMDLINNIAEQNNLFKFNIDYLLTLSKISMVPTGPPVMTFSELVKSFKSDGLSIAEIGVFIGNTTMNYAPYVKQKGGKIYLIDIFEQTTRQMVEYNLRKVNAFDVCKIIVGKSQDVADEIPNNSLDICFIDGSHNYSDVKKDIELYLPKVKTGGILCGHDFDGKKYINKYTNPLDLEADGSRDHVCHAGVIQAVYDAFGDNFECTRTLNDRSPFSWVKQL